MNDVIRLFPTPSRHFRLKGLYLNENLHQVYGNNRPFIYGNFITSLDGRIALIDSGKGGAYMPEGLSNDNDLRLLCELQAQADCIITHGGYLRELAQGKQGNILQVGALAVGSDLPAWRKQQGLQAQPHVVVASSSLDFPLPDFLRAKQGRVSIATGRKADPERVNDWRSQGYHVFFAGENNLAEGALLAQELAAMGYRCIYLLAGPQMLDTMMRQGLLARLYLTLRHQLVGGEAFHSMIPGKALGKAGNLKLRSLFYDTTKDSHQLFASYEP